MSDFRQYFIEPIIENPNDAPWEFRMEEVSSDDPRAFVSIRMQEILSDTAMDRIDLLKIDIEGAERFIFSEGFEDWLSLTDVLIIETHDRFAPGCSKAVRAAATSWGLVEFPFRENVLLFGHVGSLP